jgi:Formaldehyde-activating enzyme (Fae)
MSELKIDRVLVGEALVGDGNEVAHIDLIMGPRGSAAEIAFCTTLTNQKVGDNALLALVRPNLMTKPATVMFNKVDIKNGDQAGKMFGEVGCHPQRRSREYFHLRWRLYSLGGKGRQENPGMELRGDEARDRTRCQRRTVNRRGHFQRECDLAPVGLP